MVSIAERRDSDGAVGEVLDLADLIRLARRRRDGEQRQPAGRREAADLGAMGIGLQRDAERGRAVLDGAADQRLHRRVAAARIDQLGVEPMLGEMPVGAGDLVGDDAEELAAEGDLDLPALRPADAGTVVARMPAAAAAPRISVLRVTGTRASVSSQQLISQLPLRAAAPEQML
ncbi:MAG: hypothetical protein JWL84_3267 [Rhodospirillales bacterium]|jgi:hypothetical protein|nr:hypothetical protein [Rhodospirillales bacterium]